MDGVPSKIGIVGVGITLLILQIVRACPTYSKMRPMSMGHAKDFGNGSVTYGDTMYPRDYYLDCICSNVTGSICLRKCCDDYEVLDQSINCVKLNETSGMPSLRLSDNNLTPDLRSLNNLEDHFYMMKGSRFCTLGSFKLEPENIPADTFVVDGEGILRTSELELKPDRYCLDWQVSLTEVRVVVCFITAKTNPATTTIEAKIYPVGMMISIPFMIATLFVYAIISELRNLYGKTLMCYVGCLIYAYSALVVIQLGDITQLVCVSVAFTIHFSFLASFFWLNVMCFDIWWTFGGFRSLQGSIKQREKKKFLMYSIYAWGCASVLTAVCVIMDFVPGIPDTILRPEFGTDRCWFRTEEAKALYFYGPMGITVICNIILFISTAAKIIQHKKDTAHHLKGMDSKRHDDNKQWFNLYLKLFIVMGINWSMEIISWLCQGPKSLWYLTDIANSLQGVIIFIIFVWKQKIKRLLMKRFGCQGKNFLSRDSTRSAYHSSSSRNTCTTSMPLQEKTNPLPDPSGPRPKHISDDSDGV